MKYIDIAQEKMNKLRDNDNYVVLAIESSCDETACAIMRGDILLANVIASQIEIHRRFGGVVPEVASRNHTLAIDNVVTEALNEAKITLQEVDCIAVTYGAGLLGALIVGVAYAKSLAYALGVPLIAVNHIKGHIAANYIADSSLKPPYLCLIASGGHSAIVGISDYNDIRIIGQTVDDACGEAFDKVARALGLPYPGGVEIERLAVGGSDILDLPIPFKGESHYNFSYSGLKTAVVNYLHKIEQRGEKVDKQGVAFSFQKRAIDMLVGNAIRACKELKYSTIVIAGGVGANKYLREEMQRQANCIGAKAVYPPLKLCTDNAAMIASEARVLIAGGVRPSDLDLDADANVKITD